MSYYEVDK